jgi:hypothetical protein
MQMTGDDKGVEDHIGYRVWYRGEESNLLQDRAVNNMEFVKSQPNNTWFVPQE